MSAPARSNGSSAGLSRRAFLGGSALTAAAAGLAGTSRTRAATATVGEPGTVAPRPLARHRNLFNGDCNFLFYNPELWQPEGGPYRATAIHRFVTLLARSGVDTLLVNPNTQVAWYPSAKLESVLRGYRRGDRDYARRIAAGNAGLSPAQAETFINQLIGLLDLYLDLSEAGVDWLAECAVACRQQGISPWLSYRMNATHFSGAPDSPVNGVVFRDPANRLSGRVPGPGNATHAGWVGLNYGQRAVRDHMLALIREGIETYDYEGLELDWLRHPVCLEAGASAGATEEMTEWFAGIRALASARRPGYPVGLRIPSNLPYLRSIGIDVKALVRRGLIDFVTVSNFWQTSWEMPHDELRRELGPEVTIYGGMEDAPNWLEAYAPALTVRPEGPEIQLAGDNALKTSTAPARDPAIRGTRYLTASAEFMRANAAGKLVLGADGLEQFNFFVTDQVRVPGQRGDYAALRQLTDLAFLRGKEKHYALNTTSVQPTKLWDVPEQLPVRIAPRHRRALRLPMCAEPADAPLRLVIQVVLPASAAQPALGVSLNGAWPGFAATRTQQLLFPCGPYRDHVAEHAAWNFSGNPQAIREGWNEIVLYNESAEELNVIAVEVGLIDQARP